MPRYVVDLVLDQLVSLDVRKKISPGRRARHASSASVAPRTNPMSRWPSKSAHWIRPSRHTLAEVVGMAFSAVTSGDVCGFFEHRGYRMAVELSLPQLALRVVTVYIRASSGAGAVHHQESVALGQRPLGLEGGGAQRHGAVDHDDCGSALASLVPDRHVHRCTHHY